MPKPEQVSQPPQAAPQPAPPTANASSTPPAPAPTQVAPPPAPALIEQTAKRSRGPLIAIVGAAVLGLVTGVAFGVPQFREALFGGQDSGGSGGNVSNSTEAGAAFTVTGQPPSSNGTWRSGVKEVWSMIEPSDGSPGDFFVGSSKAILAGVWSDASSSRLYYGLDPSTGEVIWSETEWGYAPEWGYLDCAKDQVNGLVPCLLEGKTLALMDFLTTTPEKQVSLLDVGLPLPGSEADFFVEVFDGSIITVSPRCNSDYCGDLSETGFGSITISRFDVELKMIWQKEITPCNPKYDAHRDGSYESWMRGGVLGVTYRGGGLQATLDFETGEQLLPAADSACIPVEVVGPKTLQTPVESGDATPLPLGFKQIVDPNVVIPLLEAPPSELRLSTVSDTPGSSATVTSDAGWTLNVLSSWSTWMQCYSCEFESWEPGSFHNMVYNAYDGTTLMLFPGVDFSEETGYILDTVTVDPLSAEVLKHVDVDYGFDVGVGCYAECTDDGLSIVLLADGTWLMDIFRSHSGSINSLLDPVSANTIERLAGYSKVYYEAAYTHMPGLLGTDALFGHYWSDSDNTYVRALYIPSDAMTSETSIPSTAPACPAGGTPVDWIHYPEGDILVCAFENTYRIVYTAHADWTATELNWGTDGSYEIVFSNGCRLRVALGGRILLIDQDGQRTTYQPTQSWSASRGEMKPRATRPTQVQSCPAGTWPISLSYFSDGRYLLVCGTAADQPTRLIFVDGVNDGESDSVSYSSGAYCAQLAVGKVCAYSSPAVITITDANGNQQQYSVEENYFSDTGAGGAGEGAGSYGVPAPEDNAEDQVRYLVEIMEKAHAGRQDIDTAVDQVRNCNDLEGARTLMAGVTQNRQELLDALDSTPVDRVVDGSLLISRLRTALELAKRSDEVWEQWAADEQANGCRYGEESTYYKTVRKYNEEVADAKATFLETWNNSIVPTYGVRSWLTEDI
jgi:hypothetical protein